VTASHQLGLFVRPRSEERLPYPDPFTTSELSTIEDALTEAWRRVVRNGVSDTDDEVHLTARLIDELDQLMSTEPDTVAGFDSDTFETPVRGGELQDYRGDRLEKRPDIVFRPAGRQRAIGAGIRRRQFWGLFVECKIVDQGHTMSTYCRDGLQRFVNGNYAWAVSSAMMLGYARDGYALPLHLERHFRRKDVDKRRYGRHGDTLSSRAQGSRAWVSRHDRNWRHVEPAGADPGVMTVVHLWLDLDDGDSPP
jgi:hypothetical protein